MVDLPTESEPVKVVQGDCLEVLRGLDLSAFAALVIDPPYGIDYESGMTGHHGGTALPGILGDADTSLRDAVLAQWPRSAIVFGSWKRPRPAGCKAVLTWDKGIHVGMGDLSFPWKPNTEEVYVIGNGFSGHRGSAVLSHPAPVSWNSVRFGRVHPHEKPVSLMRELIAKCPPGVILDTFAGSGTTGVAAVLEGRRCLLIEQDAGYCEVARRRVAEALGTGPGQLPFATGAADLFAAAT